LEYNLPNEKQRSRIRERLEHWGVRLQRAYNREQCGYFDPGSPNAADPNPDVNQKLNKSRKSRARRDIDDYDEWMVCSFYTKFENIRDRRTEKLVCADKRSGSVRGSLIPFRMVHSKT